MKEIIPLKRLYEAVSTDFPSHPHDPEKFLCSILDILDEDPLRTSAIRNLISEHGLDHRLHRVFPLNDFLAGASRYLIYIGVAPQEASAFEHRYNDNKELLFS